MFADKRKSRSGGAAVARKNIRPQNPDLHDHEGHPHVQDRAERRQEEHGAAAAAAEGGHGLEPQHLRLLHGETQRGAERLSQRHHVAAETGRLGLWEIPAGARHPDSQPAESDRDGLSGVHTSV